MEKNVFNFKYDENYGVFKKKFHLKNLEITTKEKESINILINYFSEDKNYKYLSNPSITKFIISTMIIIHIVILLILSFANLNFYKIKNLIENSEDLIFNKKYSKLAPFENKKNIFVNKNNYYLGVALGMCFLVYFILFTFLLTHEILKKNLYNKLKTQELLDLEIFKKKYITNTFFFDRNHKKKSLFLMKCFSIYDFEFILKFQNENEEQEKKSLLKNSEESFDFFKESSISPYDDVYRNESIFYERQTVS